MSITRRAPRLSLSAVRVMTLLAALQLGRRPAGQPGILPEFVLTYEP
ncbi:hypothetical protein [Streptomyces sp. NBC_00272]|nr:hypothetical protein [Streptomyces sp. NBC_00272]